MTNIGTPLPQAFRLEEFPLDRFDTNGELTELLSKIYVTEYTETFVGDTDTVAYGLSIAEELVINLVGVDGFAFILGGVAATTIRFGYESSPGSFKVLLGAGARLRFPRSMLKPVKKENEQWIDDPLRPYAEIAISAGIIIDNHWNVSFDGANAFRLEPAMIADSGFVVEGTVSLDLSESTQLPGSAALGLAPTWQGVIFDNLTLHMPPDITDAVPIAAVQFTNFHIGSGGVSGRIALNGPAPAPGKIGGFAFAPTTFAVELRQNALTEASLAGQLTVPFFDGDVNVQVGFDLNGNFTVAIDSATGLITLDKPDLLSLSLTGLGLAKRQDVWTISLSGAITPHVAGLDWPTFQIQSLSIDTNGNVMVDGGWIDLAEQYVLSFYGFQFSISKLGFGTTIDNRRWIGFNGGLKLVDGLSAGASVEGMRITWDPNANPATNSISLSLEGVGVEFDVPNVVSFKGFVSMTEPRPNVLRFDGNITLSLHTIGLEVEAQLVIGYNEPDDFTFFAIYLGVELPAGIPLWTTGLGLYGLAGLFALNMEPGRRDDEPWYAIQPSPSWYHRNPPGVGVAQLRKWDDAKGSLGFGAGVTIGTVADNGFTFAGRLLLAIVFPGPLIFIEGRANILKSRASLNDDPLFRALMVIDGREGEILLGLDARFKIDDGAELIDIHGGVEAFFDFDDPMAWHLYLGVDEPIDRRIGAEIFQGLFKANAYFMLDARRIRTGAWVGIDERYNFGPVSVGIAAWMEGKAELSFAPPYLSAGLQLHGSISAKIFGFGFSLSADARVGAGVFDPFHVIAGIEVTLELPWPLPDIHIDLTLEWGPEPVPPLLPVPLKEVAIAHNKVTTTWPLAIDAGLVTPKMDLNSPKATRGFFDNRPPATPAALLAAPPPVSSPIVPLDARPDLTFAIAMHDDANIGVNQALPYDDNFPKGWFRIGDPERNEGPVRARPSVQEVVLERWNGTAWTADARKGAGTNPGSLPTLFGSWAAVAAPTTGPGLSNTKLRVWSKNPFDFAARSHSDWIGWATRYAPGYPCIPTPQEQTVCINFSQLPLGASPTAPYRTLNNDVFSLTWVAVPAPVIKLHDQKTAALCVAGGADIIALLHKPALEIIVTGHATPGDTPNDCVDFRDRKAASSRNPRKSNGFTLTTRQGGNYVPSSEIRITNVGGVNLSGLDVTQELLVTIEPPTTHVSILLSTTLGSEITAYDERQNIVTTVTVQASKGLERVELQSNKEPIALVRIYAKEPSTTFVHELCAARTKQATFQVTSVAANGTIVDTATGNGRVSVSGRNAVRAVIESSNGVCIESICVRVGPTAAELIVIDTKQRHMIDELARWAATGEVLKPYSNYRLKITTRLDVNTEQQPALDPSFNGTRTFTQLAFFRTDGPPGLANYSVPVGHPVTAQNDPDAPPFTTGLEDLSTYVHQTIPATVPVPGEQPKLPRPVYRAYDVGVKFNENYVDQMYSQAGRDLALYLYDTNDQPVRDQTGRILSPSNKWGRVDTRTGTATQIDERYKQVLRNATCLGSFATTTVTRNRTLTETGFVLNPRTIYEARLTPMAMRENFLTINAGTIATTTQRLVSCDNEWVVIDTGTVDGPSQWIIQVDTSTGARSIRQTTNIGTPGPARNAAFVPGSILLLKSRPSLGAASPHQPSQWADYRMSVNVRSQDDDIVGVGVRVNANGAGYFVTLDRQNARRRLIKIRPQGSTVLAESTGSYQPNSDVFIQIEVVGDHIRVFFDGYQMFHVTDNTHPIGTVALYSADNAGSEFSDIRIDDLATDAPVVYRFKFATSEFADVIHHIHSGNDRVYRLKPSLLTAADLTRLRIEGLLASSVNTAPTQNESRLYETIATKLLGPAAALPVVNFEVSATNNPNIDTDTNAVLIRTAEPIDWSRTSLHVTTANAPTTAGNPLPVAPTPSRSIKITDATFASTTTPDPFDESISILVTETAPPTDIAIQTRILPTPTSAPPPPHGTVIARPDFIVTAAEQPTRNEPFWAPQLTDATELEFITPPGIGTPGWVVAGGQVTKTGTFRGYEDSLTPIPARHPGALGLAPESSTAFTFSCSAIIGPQASGGIVFRYIDVNNHYRFAIDEFAGAISFAKIVNGVFSSFGNVPIPPTAPSTKNIVLTVSGNTFTAAVTGTITMTVNDNDLRDGQFGIYAYGPGPVAFTNLNASAILRPLNEWTIYDTNTASRSNWKLAYGALQKPAETGIGETFATLQHLTVADFTTTITLEISDHADIVFRYTGPNDYLAIRFNRNTATTSFIRVAHGITFTEWVSPWNPVGNTTTLAIEAVGTRTRISIDATATKTAYVPEPTSGTIGVSAPNAEPVTLFPFALTHTEPQWEQWHTMRTANIASGTRFRIRAATEPANYTPPPGEIAEWIDMPTAGFIPTLRPEGSDLRVITNGTAGAPPDILHARRHLPPNAYTTTDVRIVRASDSSAFALVGITDETLHGKWLRLTFTSKLDNTAADPNALILYRDGRSDAETTTIDIG